MSVRKNERHAYLIFHLKYPGLIWAELDEDGTAWLPEDRLLPSGEHVVLTNIINSMKRGVYTTAGYNLWCVPNRRDRLGNLTAKRKDCRRLGKLFAPKKIRGSQIGLRSIPEKHRYKGKVDWESERSRIASWLKEGLSRGAIARRLQVSPSTLSEANKRFKLYPPKQPVA